MRLAIVLFIGLAALSCSDRSLDQLDTSANPTFRRVEFASLDGVEITADLYRGVSDTGPTVLLFHQSGSSRGEFRRVAPRLQALGYNALAVDLRWGGEWEGVTNETARRYGTDSIASRVEAGTQRSWPIIDASYGDMVAALRWLDAAGYSGARYVLGSSISAMLVFRLGVEETVAGVMAFSPAEYDDERPALVTGWAARVEVPVLNVAAPDEVGVVGPVADAVGSAGSLYHVASIGGHGASIIHADERTWTVLATFLSHHTGGPPRRLEVEVETSSGSLIVLDQYDGPGDGRVVALFHQGGGSARGEYGFLVPRLLDLGFDVVAADLRGGGDRFGHPNRTIDRVPEPDDFGYCDALPGVHAVLGHARTWRPESQLVVWGSSYSGALALHAAADDPTGVDRVLAFSPASGGPMAACPADAAVARVAVPALIVRPAREAAIPSVQRQLELVRAAGLEALVAEPGVHGSSTLNPVRVEGDVGASWDAVRDFLDRGRR